jgi:membrane associated rhomboid family serine protease
MTQEEPESLFARSWDVPRRAHVLPIALAILLLGVWALMPESAVSATTLSWIGIRHGHASAVLLHMFAHGNLLHVVVNTVALLAISAPLITSLGDGPLAWARYLYLFVGSGFAGAIAFLALDRDGTSAMLGASGAIFGLLGALARVHPATGTMVPIRSARTWLLAKGFVRDHLLLFAILAIASVLGGKMAGIAWQAHVGGLLFGVFAASLFLRGGETAD